MKDIKKLLTYYQVWIHNMKPDMNVESAVERIEKLCRNGRMKLYLDGCIAEERRQRAGIITELTRHDDDYDDNVVSESLHQYPED